MSIKENKENIGPLNDEVKIVNMVRKWHDDAEHDTDTWRNKQDKWYRMRQRVKKKKDKPFVGCSNMRMPTIDTKIKKLKASLMQSVFGIRPVVSVLPTPSGNHETAKDIEKFLDHIIMDVVKIEPKATIAIDQSLEKGFYCMKPFWCVEVLDREQKFDVNSLAQEQQLAIFDPETPREQM